MTPKRLGKGLDALLGTPDKTGEITELGLNELGPGRHQPRESMQDGKLQELAASISETGVLQPVIARKAKKGYEIVMGERRWRAARIAGLKTIPVVIREVNDRDALVMALVENLQREDLNPIEKARAFKRLIETLSLTQAKAAQRLGISRVAVSNTLRLLELPVRVKEMLAAGKLTAGHARALLMVKDAARIRALADKIVLEGLSVRQVEEMVGGKSGKRKAPKSRRPSKSPQILAIERELSQLIGTKVKVDAGAKGGRLVVEFYNADDFEQIIAILRKGAGTGKSRAGRK